MPVTSLGTTCAALLKEAKLQAFEVKAVLSWEKIADIIDKAHAAHLTSSTTANGKVTAEQVYQAYPRRKGKIAALAAITRASKIMPMDQLLTATKAYAEECQRNKQDMKYVAHPSTWFNQGHYLNEADPVAERSQPDYDNSNPLG